MSASSAYANVARQAGGGSRGAAETTMPDASADDLRLVRTICQMVARQFYLDQHVIMIDMLSRYPVMPADILAGSLGVPTKDLLQIANQLVRDRLIGIYKRSEVRESTSGTSVFTRNAMRSYFYLNRKVFLDVTKWRMMKMRLQIDSVLRNELDNKGYMCPRCGKSYSTLDVAALLDPMTSLSFICDVPGCGSELVDNEDAEDVQRSKDRLRRFNEQCGPILDRLRKVDAVTLPSFDVLREIEKNGDSDAWRLRARQRIDPNATMKDVLDAQASAQKRAGSMEITMVSNDPAQEAARRAQREREAERQKQENALPAWWKSTQDPNAALIQGAQREQDATANGVRSTDKETGDANASNQVQDDYYARYASMAQDTLDDEDGLELEDVEDESATPSAGPSAAHTPSIAAGKRSREDSPGSSGVTPKKAKDASGMDEEDEEELEFEDVT